MVFAAALLLSGCDKSSSLEEMGATRVALPDGTSILADTMVKELDLTRGLMFRDSLPQDRGAIMIYATDAAHAVFTYNVRFPIDVIWIDRNLRIVAVQENIPPCTAKTASGCPRYGGAVKSRYVLEMNAGAVAKHALRVGERVDF